MKAILYHRHYGVHTFIKETPLPFSTHYIRNGKVNEDLLIAALPKRFLPVNPKEILLMVGDKYGSSGQSETTQFHSWAKYFDAYSIEIRKGT